MENEAEHAQSSMQNSILTLPSEFQDPIISSETQMENAQSSAILPTLPSELINEILLRLPVKILLRFRSVSKSWLALISSPQFINTHLSLSANNKDYAHHRLILSLSGPKEKNLNFCSVRSILNESVLEPSDLDCPLKDKFQIMGSVNGLICLRVGVEPFFIWNPSIRKFKKVTAEAVERYGQKVYGFGYDKLHDDYKILRMYTTTSNDLKVEIYSLTSDSWRTVDDFPAGRRQCGSAKLVNGKLHWVSSDSNPWCNEGCIISFDLADEKWGKLEKPCYRKGEFCNKLGVLGSDLCMFHDYEKTCADVWVMKEYGVKESWAKIYTINFSHDISNVWFPLFCKSHKGEFFLAFRSTFMIYNPKDDSIRYLEVANSSYCFAEDFYIESLVCPFANDIG
ncbi:F-box/kelch-repeat protein At3g23880-like isoform X1 [Lycium barbarum]|uniref:F-box/kelch-repeat protein At3g23880-like isoform X1 n=2 Tax=Lycium barbarum TaxID=112863 RepID=UPI00293E9B64|nr:F-box/kelch-repeat protein At3g23880-like isoform X1 [Lycium barbarum]